MIRYLWLKNTPSGPPAEFADVEAVAVDVRPQYDVTSFEGFDVVIVPMHADQRHLVTLSAPLDAFLDDGGSVLVNGHIAWPFLPELTRFVPLKSRGLQDLQIRRDMVHPLFRGVPTDSLTFTRGVAGFYGRGGNPAPPNAMVIHSVGAERLPVDWLVERPSGGRLFVHSGNDIFPFLIRAGVLKPFLSAFGRRHAIADSH